CFFFSSRRRHTRSKRDWSSDVCSSDLPVLPAALMIEWLAHGALHPNPGLAFAGFDDFRVLKGVSLSDSPVTLRVLAAKAERDGEVGRASCRERVASSVSTDT